jgi:hypothetical protein
MHAAPDDDSTDQLNQELGDIMKDILRPLGMAANDPNHHETKWSDPEQKDRSHRNNAEKSGPPENRPKSFDTVEYDGESKKESRNDIDKQMGDMLAGLGM